MACYLDSSVIVWNTSGAFQQPANDGQLHREVPWVLRLTWHTARNDDLWGILIFLEPESGTVVYRFISSTNTDCSLPKRSLSGTAHRHMADAVGNLRPIGRGKNQV